VTLKFKHTASCSTM